MLYLRTTTVKYMANFGADHHRSFLFGHASNVPRCTFSLNGIWPFLWKNILPCHDKSVLIYELAQQAITVTMATYDEAPCGRNVSTSATVGGVMWKSTAGAAAWISCKLVTFVHPKQHNWNCGTECPSEYFTCGCGNVVLSIVFCQLRDPKHPPNIANQLNTWCCAMWWRIGFSFSKSSQWRRLALAPHSDGHSSRGWCY